MHKCCFSDLSSEFPQVQDLQSISRLGFKSHQVLSSLHGHNTDLKEESGCWGHCFLFENAIILFDVLKHSQVVAGQSETSRHSGQRRRTSRARLRPDNYHIKLESKRHRAADTKRMTDQRTRPHTAHLRSAWMFRVVEIVVINAKKRV